MTFRDQQQADHAQAHMQAERLQASRDEFITACLEPVPTPTESFLSGLRIIHSVNPRQAAADIANDERTEGFAKRRFRISPHE